MTVTELKQSVLPSLLAGTARQPLSSEASSQPNGALAALSLAGQWLRFERPAAPSSFAVEPVDEDKRRIVPDHLRRPMLRLLTSKTATEHPAIAVARAFDALSLRPHPFDLPKLDAFVREYNKALGATAQQWAQRQANAAEPSTYYDNDTLDDANWTQAPLAKRASYLAERRNQDPQAARGLLQAVWPQETADARFRLLQAIQIGLTNADQSFLESLEKDRAPRVRQLSRRLLAKLGTGGENPALPAAFERIKSSQAGLVHKRTVLELELPATVKDQAAPGWVHETFADVGLQELARALNLSELDMVEAAADDANLLVAFALMATLDRRFDVLAATVNHLPNAWQLLSDTGLADLGVMTAAERLQWAEILIRPYGGKLPWDYPAWSWLHLMLHSHAPAPLLDAAFRSNWFDETPTVAKHTPYWMEVTAALCPPSQRGQLRDRISTFDPALTITALQLLDLLDALEKNTADA